MLIILGFIRKKDYKKPIISKSMLIILGFIRKKDYKNRNRQEDICDPLSNIAPLV